MRNILSVVVLGLFAVGAIGWVFNVVAIVHASQVTGLVIARVVGIFIVPLGSVLGFL